MECTILGAIGVVIVIVITYKLVDALIRIPRIDSLDSRYILVTGCDSGFGRDFVERLDGLGCRVFAGCLTKLGEEELKQACSDRVVPLNMDVSDPDSVQAAYEFVCNKLPPGKGLWGVCNNAGVSGNNGPVEWLILDDYRDCMAVNLLGMIDVTTVFLPLVKRSRGRVVNMASVMGRISFESMAPYCITKYGVEAFSDSLRRQMKPFGVSVQLIEPGWFKTKISSTTYIKTVTRKIYNRCSPDVKQEYGEDYVDQIYHLAETVIEKVKSTKTYLVVDAYVHAMLGKYPRARYVVGADAKYVLLPIQSLPTYLGDAVLSLGTKPTPKVCRQGN